MCVDCSDPLISSGRVKEGLVLIFFKFAALRLSVVGSGMEEKVVLGPVVIASLVFQVSLKDE